MTTSLPQSAPAYNYDEVLKGVHCIWNNRFDEAEEIFKPLKEQNPRYSLHYAESIFLRSFITADSEDTAASMERLKVAKDLAENHIKAYEKGVDPLDPLKKLNGNIDMINKLLDARIVYGEALYSIAVLQMTRDAKLKGAFNLRKSWKVFEKALKESKTVKDVEIEPEIVKCLQFGAGFFLFAISIIPTKFLKFVELAGFKADRDAGLHYVKECQKHGGVRGPYSTMLLLFNNLLLPRGLANASSYLIEADELIMESLVKFPNGSLFHVMGSHCARKQCDIDKGIKLMETALDNSKHFKCAPLIYRYELANCYCMKLEWQKAAELYLPLIDEQKFQVRIICCLQLGSCYMMLGQKDKAMAVFNKMMTMSGKKSHFDPVVLRQTKRYIANGANFAAFELLYLRRDLAKMIPIMSSVLKSLDEIAKATKANEPVVPKIPVKQTTEKKGFSFAGLSKLANQITKKKDATDYVYDDRASYLLMKSSILKALGNQDDAIECLKEIISMQDNLIEKLYIPYCLYELGESYYVKGMLKEAEEMMVKCSKINGYDWEDPLKIRLKVTMDQLKKGNKPPSDKPLYMSIDSMVGGDDKDPIDIEEPGSDDEFEEKEKQLSNSGKEEDD